MRLLYVPFLLTLLFLSACVGSKSLDEDVLEGKDGVGDWDSSEQDLSGEFTEENDLQDVQDAADADSDQEGSYVLETGVSWQWQLSESIDLSYAVDVYDIDLFDVSLDTITALKAQGKTVICYFSAGSAEDWREDYHQFPAEALGNGLSGWEGERWLDITHPGIRPVLTARFELAQSKGCDGVEPDNVDAFINASGFELSAQEQLEFNIWLASQAHLRQLSVGLKNDVDQLEELVQHFDWALNEECFTYNECNKYSPFIQANKAVLHVEYAANVEEAEVLAASMCGALPAGFSTLIKHDSLDAWAYTCP